MFLNVVVCFVLCAVAHSLNTNCSEIDVFACAVPTSPLAGVSVPERILSQIKLIKMEVNERKSLLAETGKLNSLSQYLQKSPSALGYR